MLRIVLLLGWLLGVQGTAWGAQSTAIQVEVTVPVCGDSVVEQSETCDPPGTQGTCDVGATCTAACTCSATTASTNVSLAAGLNLVSFPVVLDERYLPGLLSSIEGDYVAVHGFEGTAAQPWTSHVAGRLTLLDSLKRIDPHQGFWLEMSQAATLSLTGTTSEAVNYNLGEGWNLISFPSPTSVAAGTAFQDVSDVIIAVWEYDTAAVGGPWRYWAPSDGASTLTTLRPGFGYFVESASDELWRFEDGAYEKRFADLRIVSVTPDPFFPVIPGGGATTTSVDLDLAIVNEGDRVAENVIVRLYDLIDGVQTLLATYTFEQIGAGETVRISDLSPINFIQTFDLTEGNHQLRFQIDPDGDIEEEDELNNSHLATIAVQPPYTVSIARSNTAGTAPAPITFTPTVTGGAPPFSYLWIPDQTDVKIQRGQQANVIFSNTGTRSMELAVTDATGEIASGISTVTISPDANTQNRTLTLEDQNTFGAVAGRTDQVQIDLFAKNTSTTVVGRYVRLDVVIFDRDDPGRYTQMIYSGLVDLPPLTTDQVSITSPVLPNGNFTLQAILNPFGAIPESDLSDNGFSADFTSSGSTQGAPIEVGVLVVDPLDAAIGLPMVATLIDLSVDVTNNDIVQRLVKGLFYGTDYLGQNPQRLVGGGVPVVALDPGETQTIHFRYRLPERPSTILSVRIVDRISEIVDEEARDILATTEFPLTIGAYDFKAENFQACASNADYPNACSSSPEGSVLKPITFSAQVTNLSPLMGNVKFDAYIDGTVLESGFINNLAPGETRIFQTRVESDTGGSHTGALELQPIAGSFLLEELMWDSYTPNNVASGSFSLLNAVGCKIFDLDIEDEHPIIGDTVTLSVRVGGRSGTGVPFPMSFPISVDDTFVHWRDGTDETVTVGPKTADVGAVFERVDLTFDWTPTQTGDHVLEYKCGSETTEFAVFVSPRLTVGEAERWNVPGEEEFDYDLATSTGNRGESLERRKLWTYAEGTESFLGGDAQFHGFVSRRFVVDDGTGEPNLYKVTIKIDLGWFGLGDTAAGVGTPIGIPTGDAAFSIDGFWGVEFPSTDTTSVNTRCGDATSLPCRSRVIEHPTILDHLSEIPAALFGAIPGPAGMISSAAFAAMEALTCEKIWEARFSSRPRVDEEWKRAFVRPFLVEDVWIENGVEFMAYVDILAGTGAAGFAVSEVDFFNKSPALCDSINVELQHEIDERGIWLDGGTVEATEVVWSTP